MRVCITGGEPLLQKKDAEELAKNLVNRGYQIVLETSGHKMPPPVFWTDSCVISMDCKCPGSGMQDRMDFSLFRKLRRQDQLKFVIADEADYDYARRIVSEHPVRANIIFQPAGGVKIEWLTERILRDKIDGIRVLPQLHKIIWGERRGV